VNLGAECMDMARRPPDLLRVGWGGAEKLLEDVEEWAEVLDVEARRESKSKRESARSEDEENVNGLSNDSRAGGREGRAGRREGMDACFCTRS